MLNRGFMRRCAVIALVLSTFTTTSGTNSDNDRAIIAVMGPTGTGKSTFIHHLTGDENIVIGHTPDSETSDVKTYSYLDPNSGIPVTLVDTPGFDDSRDGVTDTDVLEKIALFLQQGGGQKLNGVIYMHRISDPRIGGLSRKNLRMLKELCGSDRLSSVRIATTYWDSVKGKVGSTREAALANGAFKSLIDAGARMVRQDNGRYSALSIVSELARKPPVEVQIVEEMKAGMPLAETSAGNVITEEMKILQKKHEQDMRDLKKEMEAAAAAKDEKLKAELAEERRLLEEKMARQEADRAKLQETRMAELQRKLNEVEEQNRRLQEEADDDDPFGDFLFGIARMAMGLAAVL